VGGKLQELLAIFELEELEAGLFRGRTPAARLQPLFGGHVIGQSVVAACRTVPPGRAIHSLHAYFLLPGDVTVPLVYEVEQVRDGGSFSARRVRARQDGRTIFVADTSFHSAAPGFEHQQPMPPSSAPESLPRLMEAFRATFGTLGEWDGLDVRWGGHWPPETAASGSHEPHNQVWLRTTEPMPEDPVLHAAVFAYVSDLAFLTPVLLPHGKLMWSPGIQATSLDHAIWFHRPFGVSDWLLYDRVSPAAADSRGLAFGAVYTASGSRVASTAQEGLVRGAAPRAQGQSPRAPGKGPG
jgi:acyl-CoA thioesterase-2